MSEAAARLTRTGDVRRVEAVSALSLLTRRPLHPQRVSCRRRQSRPPQKCVQAVSTLRVTLDMSEAAARLTRAGDVCRVEAMSAVTLDMPPPPPSLSA